jgi:hypothetical protein
VWWDAFISSDDTVAAAYCLLSAVAHLHNLPRTAVLSACCTVLSASAVLQSDLLPAVCQTRSANLPLTVYQLKKIILI